MSTAETVRQLIDETVKELGYLLYDVDFIKEPEGYILTVYIDSANGITLEDCEKVSRAIDPILDDADPIEQQYFLSVSSVGLDRPIKTDADFARVIGKKIDVGLYAPFEKKKQYTGELISYDKERFTIRTDNGRSMEFLRKSAASIRIHLDF